MQNCLTESQSSTGRKRKSRAYTKWIIEKKTKSDEAAYSVRHFKVIEGNYVPLEVERKEISRETLINSITTTRDK